MCRCGKSWDESAWLAGKPRCIKPRWLTDARDEYLVGRSCWGVLESFASRMCTIDKLESA